MSSVNRKPISKARTVVYKGKTLHRDPITGKWYKKWCSMVFDTLKEAKEWVDWKPDPSKVIPIYF